jgi:predicted Zn-dependent protease
MVGVMKRPGLSLAGAYLVPVLFAAACAINPATGKHQLMTVSEGQEIEIGREADKQIRETQGIYTEQPALGAYVAFVGAKVAAKSDRPKLAYRFSIVDTPDINAFALPGGFVYVTRGILALMNSEDELAAVLGHEIGHVAARHGAAQLSKAQAAQLGLIGVAALTDPKYAGVVTNLAGVAVNLAMQGYSRDDEREADELGVVYAKKAGYNPEGAIDLMESFKAIERDEPSRIEMWFASHPRTSERIRNISGEIAVMKRRHSKALKRPILREPYLRKIDGILYGAANGSGYVSGRRYVGTRHDYTLLVPEGWAVSLVGADVTMSLASKDLRAEMTVQSLPRAGVSGDVARDFARRAGNQGLEVLGPVTKAGLPAGEGALVRLRGKTKDGRRVIIQKCFLVRFDRAYVLTFTAPEERAENTDELFMNLTGSINWMSDAEARSYPAPRVTLYTATEGDTWSRIAAEKLGSGEKGRELAVFNGAEPGRQPKAGMLIKIPPSAVAT